VPVDLGAPHEPDVHEAALREQEGVGDPGQHGRAAPGAHLVGRDRQPVRRDLGADDPALDHQREPRRVAPPGERRREQGHADAGEDDRVVPELAGGDDREQLGRVAALGHCSGLREAGVDRGGPAAGASGVTVR